MIIIEDANIGYDTTLYNIGKLQLEPSQTYALIGRNGSGKSTLLSTILGETKPINGTIAIQGKLAALLTLQERSKMIAFVSPKNERIPYLTVRDYVSLGRYPYTNSFGKLTPEDERAIEASIQIVGIGPIAHKYTSTISDGERQLASISRALAQDTPIILMDEPTAFLDYGNRINTFQILKDIAREENKCILLTSHDIDLCIDFNFPMLLIDQQTEKLIQLEPNTPKSAILEIGFGLY